MNSLTLTLRQLNRATLERQQLLGRAALSAPQMIERLGGLQAQAPVAPFIGLWSRLASFRRQELARLIEDHEVVKVTWVRGTLHLTTASDYRRFRATLQPMLSAGWSSIARQRSFDLDLDELIGAARELLEERPRTFAEITDWGCRRFPGQDIGALRYAVRTHLPLVQVPVPTGWGYPARPQFALAESWLEEPLSPEQDLEALVLRYLEAFGPASIKDAQTWSGLARLDEGFGTLGPRLRSYREGRRELFDLAEQAIPDGDLPAPVRFLPEYDNLLLSHSQRRRVLADEHRARVYLPGLRVRATFLVDGFVAGAWKVEKSRGNATLVVEPFVPIAIAAREELEREGEDLLRFLEPAARTLGVRFAADC